MIGQWATSDLYERMLEDRNQLLRKWLAQHPHKCRCHLCRDSLELLGGRKGKFLNGLDRLLKLESHHDED